MVLQLTIRNNSSIHFILYPHFFSIIASSFLIHGWSPRHGRWLIAAIPLNIGIAGIDQSEKLEKITDHTHLTASLPLKLACRKKVFTAIPLLSTRGFPLYKTPACVHIDKSAEWNIHWKNRLESKALSTRRAKPSQNHRRLGEEGEGEHLPFVRITNILFGETRAYQKYIKILIAI